MRFLPGTSTDSTISHGPFFPDRRVQRASLWTRFRIFLWNREQRTVCNRTGKNWLILFIVYGIFLSILLAMFYLSLYIVMLYINKFDENSPRVDKLYLAGGLSPGLSTLPNIIDSVSIPLIWYPTPDFPATAYSQYLDQYFDVYNKAKNNSKYTVCDPQHPKPEGKLCLFDVSSMGPCSTPDYGYTNNTPCFYLKLNKLLGWTPEYYENDLPEEMPQLLQDTIRNHSESKQYIWVHCEGMTPYDTQHTGGVNYYPQRAFFGDFYPYEGDKDFLSPLVAVQLNRYENQYLVSIYCTVWAKNMKRKGPTGRKIGTQVHFHLDTT